MREEAKGVRAGLKADGWKVLAGLRFYLAFIVVCGHLFRFAPNDGLANAAVLKLGSLDAVAAVFCFLVISGFSIAHSITSNPVGFYKRRAMRIYPLYFFGVLTALIPFLLLGARIHTVGSVFDWPGPTTLLCNLLFLQGFACSPLPSNVPLWTLAVEVFCYVLAPVFIRLHTGWLLTIVAISASAYAVFPKLDLGFYSRLLYGLPTLFLIWAWLCGFIFYFHRQKAHYQIGLLLIGTALFSINYKFGTKFATFTYVLGATLVVYSDKIALPKKIRDLFNYLGELSYPLYILHTPAFILSYVVFGIRNAVVFVILALLSAVFFYHAVDEPLRHRRRAIVLYQPP